jgi:hypothetical protein
VKGKIVTTKREYQKMMNQRKRTHGEFKRMSEVSQGLKQYLSENKDLTPSQCEALEMILQKIARILCGNPNFKDHWDDIIGYASRISEQFTPLASGETDSID